MRAFIAIIAAAGVASSALAAFTTINKPWAGNGSGAELNLVGGDGVTTFGFGDANDKSILGMLQSDAAKQATYLSGLTISSVVRINDASDQVWFNQNGGTTATAVFSGSGQDLSYHRLDTNTTVSLGQTFGAGTGFVTGTAALATGPYNFLWHSDPSLFTASRSQQSFAGNNGFDQFVSYRLTLSDNSIRYLIGIEDNNGSNSSYSRDGDYNDFVFIMNHVVPIPAPAAALLGLIGLGTAAWAKRRGN